ncbi:MAG: hypothetical protein WC372_00280 [Candidatus Neomarinimicrobiota bacterium]|jgi:hypothetical protein|nr:hypothetical protein [Candidatus Neomarinimicrobiota bacterium]MDD3965592.1 hypothetical protein [Candidatus Neomarinimicrobiota bacterium]MDX9779426.1 hypothetical protein [bacterium]
MFYLGIFLVLWGIMAVGISVAKAGKIWNMGKIQAFVKILGNTGTRIFFIVVGLAVLGLGIWLLIAHWPA